MDGVRVQDGYFFWANSDNSACLLSVYANKGKVIGHTVFLVKFMYIASPLGCYPVVVQDCGGEFAVPRPREVRSRPRQDHIKILMRSLVKLIDGMRGFNY